MRFILALLLMSGTAMAEMQNRTYQDSMGRNTGRSVTDASGNTAYYDSMGRSTGRSTTDSSGRTTFYDAMGRNTGRSATNGNTTTSSDSFVVGGQGLCKGAGDGLVLAGRSQGTASFAAQGSALVAARLS